MRGIVLVAVLVGAGILVNRYRFEDILDVLAFSANDDAGWLHGRAAYLALAGLFTAVGGPRQAVSFFAAYFFGLADGFTIALAGSGLGCVLAYLFARLFQDATASIIRGRVEVARRIWERNTFSLTLILRLLPVGSNLVANLAAGASGIPFAAFLVGSVTGYVPQTLVFALMGAGVNVGSAAQFAISVVLFAVSTLFGVWVYARYRKRLRSENGDPSEEVVRET